MEVVGAGPAAKATIRFERAGVKVIKVKYAQLRLRRLSVLDLYPSEILTERLRLRAPRRGDVTALHEAIAETLPDARALAAVGARRPRPRPRRAATCAPRAAPGRARARSSS